MENELEEKSEGTGVKIVDTAITKTLAFEKSHLGNPVLQVLLLGLAVYGAYALTTKYLIKA